MHHTACVFLQSQRFKNQVVSCLLTRVLPWLAKILDYWDVNEVVHFALTLKDVRVRCLADLALKLPEEVATQMRLFLLASLCLHPFLQALVVNLLDSTAALASGQQRILLGGVIDPAEPTEGQLLIHANRIDVFVFTIPLALLPSDDLGHLALLSSIHPSDYLLIDSSGTTFDTLS